jgi:triosephosphate isomerase
VTSVQAPGGYKLPLFGTNVKMHQTVHESIAYVSGLASASADGQAQLFVILPFTSLAAVVDVAHRAGIWVGAQNMHWAEGGAFTGEVSAPMLRDIGIDLVLVGHAERRQLFGENDTIIRQKVEAALAHGLRVVLCVGETAEERRFGAGDESIVRQLRLDLGGVTDLANVIIAYEPVWAIGESGSAAEPAVIAAAAEAIRSVTGALPILYGGSVSAETAAPYAAIAEIDGLFVGRAACTSQGFENVLRAAYPAP